MKRIIVILAAVGLLAAAISPASPAQAATAGAAVAVCNITLDSWPGAGANSTPCAGTATGAFVEGSTTLVCVPTCALEASVDNYGETCVLNEPPLVGDAQGTITVTNGTDTVDAQYDWTRVGVTAVITTTNPLGAGVAVFIPRSVPLPTCAVPGPLNVTVAGLAVFAQP